MKLKLLIIGGSGLVGSTLLKYASSKYDIHFTYNTHQIKFNNTSSTQINLLHDEKLLLELITKIQPDIVVNTVAHSSVDLCESDHNLTDKLHVDVTEKIAQVCKDNDSKLIYISTDAVFEGKLNKKYDESDQPNPINYYGKSKLKAEKIILNASPKNVILRSAVIYGWHEKSRFTNWIIQTLKEKRMVDPFIDQYNTPTLVDDLVKSLLIIFEKNISGMFHATGNSCINRYEFALVLAKTFGLDTKLIKPVTSKEKKQDAPRPTSTCLNSTKLEKLIGFNFHDINSGVSFIFNKSKI